MASADDAEVRRTETKELLAIAVFIAVSIEAVRGFDIFPPMTEEFKEFLGPPPSQEMMSAFLVIYSFSAIIRCLGRMMSGSRKTGGLMHSGYLAAFYIFYYLSGLLSDNFWAIFAAGVTIFALEGYQIWGRTVDGEGEEP